MNNKYSYCKRCGGPKTKEVFTRTRTIRGKRIRHPKGGVFHFWVCECPKQ